ncbi:RAMP superfamily CRISPR-associated protein [Desulfobacterium sp. N47]|uniref:CRISPR type III-associated protein domain-containing protein n=1 Tax=uncultured Desulfobacterium sp. TaxID=201089 RepID=E1YMB0_9BACT|nr:hypothetical protein N47_E47550 [uncultured Desulfobacterium sp.]
MKRYQIRAKLMSPLAIRQNRQSDMSFSLPYLPGASLRGALAAKHIRDGGNPDDNVFKSLFINHSVNFGNLLPVDSEAGNSKVLPLTSASCKRVPGFRQEGKHGVSDTLIYKFAQRNQIRTNNETFCPVVECRNDVKAFSGFWNGDIDSPKEIQTSILFQRHTGIDRTTGTIASSIFFITQAMADFRKASETGKYIQQWLSGSIYIDDEQFEMLNSLARGPVFVGAFRTRGQGEIELSIEPDEAETPFPDIVAWGSKFKGKLKDIVHDKIPEDLSVGLYFSVTLESDTILVDQFLRPSSEINLPFDNIQPVLKITKPQIIRGWQAAWGLPKPDDIGLSMGSVFLFKYIGSDVDGLKQVLSTIVMKGIGLRREEGFGRISVCDPLHIQEEVV